MTDSSTDAAAAGEEQHEPVAAAFEMVAHRPQLQGHAVYAAVSLDVIDGLGREPTSIEELAAALDVNRDHTYRLCRALASFGVLDHDGGERFSTTAVGDRFRTDHPESVREFLLFFFDPARLTAVRHFPEVVAGDGATGYDLEFGKGLFEYCETHPEFARRFNGFQDLSALGGNDAVLEALDEYGFDDVETVCDIGGGYGHLLATVLVEHQDLEGTVLELPSVLEDADRLWGPKLGVEDRCRYVAGDMFESVPTADVYILQAILHDWPDDDCVQILETVRKAASPESHVLVRERVLDDSDPDPESTMMDVWMMLETGGRERTRSEFQALFDRAGWELTDVVGVEGELCLLEGRPVDR